MTDFKGIGKITNISYGGTTAVGGVSGFLGGEITTANNVNDLAGKNTILGGSGRMGGGVSGDFQMGNGVYGINGGISPGIEPSFALPAEFHGGQQNTQVTTYKEWNEITMQDILSSPLINKPIGFGF